MRTELMISIILFVFSSVLLRFISIKWTLINPSLSKRIFTGIISWIFLLSTAAWMLLFGDTFTAWLTTPEDEPYINTLICVLGFLFVYILSVRPKAPYPGIEILDYALASLSFQSVTSVSSNKLILFLRKRAFERFLQEERPDSHDQIQQQREQLLENLRQQQAITDGLKNLEGGMSIDVINTNTPCPVTLSQHPFFKHIDRLTIDPKERKALLCLVYPQIEESIENDVARTRFLRQVYDFVQAISHEHFLKQYAQYFDTLSLSLFKSSPVDLTKNTGEPILFFEISITALQRIESSYINPSKLDTIATLRFQSKHL